MNWIISANGKMYDHVAAFDEFGYIDWRQTANFEMASRLLAYKNKNAEVTMKIITTLNKKTFIDEMSSLNALKILLALNAEVFSYVRN